MPSTKSALRSSPCWRVLKLPERSFFSKKFENDTRSEAASSHNAVYERVKGLMSCAHLFDLERLPRKDRDRYGPGTFGQHTLLARTLVEEGAPFVMVANGMPWDCHVFNHEIYQMVVPDLDNIIYQLHCDLEFAASLCAATRVEREARSAPTPRRSERGRPQRRCFNATRDDPRRHRRARWALRESRWP